MRTLFIFWRFVSSLFGYGQLHNRLVKLNIGYTTAQPGYQDDIKNYNDTSKYHFELVTQLPSLSYTHEFIISDFSPKFGANLELSIWTPELISDGLCNSLYLKPNC